MHLKEREKGDLGGFEGQKGSGEGLYLNYHLKN